MERKMNNKYLKEIKEDNTMEKIAVKKIPAIFVLTLFVISICTVMPAHAAEKTMTIKGTIVSLSVEAGKVLVKDKSGKVVTLTSPKGIDLKGFKVGDQVIVKASKDGFIKSVTKQG